MSSDHIWPILFFVSLAGNLILLFYRPLLRLLRRGEEVSEDEIMAMVEEGEESGAIERNEKELIENVFEFNNTTAEDASPGLKRSLQAIPVGTTAIRTSPRIPSGRI